MTTRIEVGVDATIWWNDRGFGRFTREIVKALVARPGRLHYTLFVDREIDVALPSDVRTVMVRTRHTVTESAVGSGSRSVADMCAFSRAVARARLDLFFFPAVYSYFPIFTRVPCLITFHDTIAERYGDLMFPTRRNRLLWQTKVRLARLQACRVLTVSQASAHDLETLLGIPPERIDIASEAAAPLFCRLQDRSRMIAIRERYQIPEGAELLVYVGGLNPHKNLLGLLRCLPGVLREHPNTLLAIVGDTSGRGFRDNVSELHRFVKTNPPLEKHVSFTGYVSEEDLLALYNSATALVLPSLWEGFGLPAVEAMACGLPVVASRGGSLPEVVGDAGVFFDPQSPGEMATAICSVLRDAELRNLLSRKALARAALFTWDRGASLVEASFERCLEGRERKRCALS